jgi:hypothetical protein
MELTEERPSDLIKELARFAKPTKLNLFVLLPLDEPLKARWRDYWRIAREFYHERMQIELMGGTKRIRIRFVYTP